MRQKQNYELGQPPRAVPLSVRFQVLFGGFFNQFGWLFFGFGLIFVWIFTLNSNLQYMFTFKGELNTAQGKITKVEPTNTTVNGRHIYEYEYLFEFDGRTFKGMSYSSASGYRQGKTVTVEFPAGDPSVSRIQGMSKGMIPAWVGLIPAIFPLIGFCFIMVGLKKGGKGVYLLKNGEEGKGRLKSKQPTNVRINNQTVYKLTFELEVGGTPYEITTKTHTPGNLEDQEEEPLLYDPMFPSFAELMDNLPGSPEIDENGFITPKSIINTLFVMLLPLLTVGGHGTFLFFKYFA